jgi:ABC-type microcin C transport system duplicated ATPase subunit YejF
MSCRRHIEEGLWVHQPQHLASRAREPVIEAALRDVASTPETRFRLSSTKFSGGQRQRHPVARAVGSSPTSS